MGEQRAAAFNCLDLLVESPMGFPEGPFFILLGVPAGRNAPETPIFVVFPVFASRGVREAPIP